MSLLTLDSQHRPQLAAWLETDDWVVACLCAAWCDTCRSYRSSFAELAAQHPEKHFVWIDIEDEAEVVGDMDVDNFPTLLIQRRDDVAFFGTVLPDPKVADRLIASQTATSLSHTQQSQWQEECNLRRKLAEC